MKHQKRSRRQQKRMRNWSRERAIASLPYVVPVVRSIREHKLSILTHRRKARRLDSQPGRPTRDMIIAREEALRDADRAKAQYSEALRELRALNLKSIDPIRGIVYFPFKHANLMAWLIFDLFEAEPLQHWRYRDDDDDVRRPLSELEQEPDEETSAPKRRKPR